MKLLLIGPQEGTMRCHNHQACQECGLVEAAPARRKHREAPDAALPAVRGNPSPQARRAEHRTQEPACRGGELREDGSPLRSPHASTTTDLLEGGRYPAPIYVAEGNNLRPSTGRRPTASVAE
ncbi:hypothetical protein ABB37_04732 [Leptomonas pyrrhocoris]|uniref:Uncharacterized protein n=1 Tax=Leptomonas pyrrhocoris TaxID=157538 RepID=A0A0M9G1J9_LEPPY|nr:hypothetical protein ABB37_05829 [Leptomonas pyrrhocoris]XP_015657132.1 hypothetical protein ABB37_05829 [Leptomonas pyrrhocoris]XP_015658959.1 hypothetical protein ABB37_04732 [Leptomonas pyrrhocoris]XP_015658960.1 hypothetical protein ABB37_04732 [Leptomonas pyrrhocoris]KPA78692.1 hypothetical protein ABB37_05829 [Leptomonas pyrrhocoris]KPA78693.1 hypothetical protein ABB37_05829 [Leptomonas pyrrhocoris]KPA80520.1 hypothetical protein ABB37_04732 [Leptomonas pyrrhocoris]KPA80521.1 hypot|eukprot:XP_015657131.1 hypothetical protein ABB37_05829 [Leptomonas pyrrhocoris]